MSKKIYVGNLPYTASENELRGVFGEFGDVLSVNLITDRETGRARGFGFVEMNDDEALSAIQALDGRELGGRPMRVNEARPRRNDGGGGGGGGGGRRDRW